MSISTFFCNCYFYCRSNTCLLVADYRLLAEDYSRANQEAIRVALWHLVEERESHKLLGFEPSYRYTAPRRSRVTDFLRAPSAEPDPNLPPIKLVLLTAEQEMAKIWAIKSMITGEPSDSQLPEAAGGTSSTPAVQDKGAVLALTNEQAAGQSMKRSRRGQSKQHLVDEDSIENPFVDLGTRLNNQSPSHQLAPVPLQSGRPR